MSVADLVRAEAARQGVDPNLALRVAGQESGFDQSAVSPKGAGGVMQLMPKTARGLGVDPTDLNQNIRGGVTYLKQQLDTFKDPRLALAAYNAGPAAVRRAGGVPNFAETKNYVGKIMGDQSQSGADIFGAEAPASAAPQDGSGADIFAAAPAPARPAAPPVPAPAVAPQAAPEVSQRLGFEQGFAKPYGKAAELLGATGSSMGLHLPGWLKTAAANLQAAQADSDQQHFAGMAPGKAGQFVGNMASTSYLPGGPMTSGAMTGLLLSDKKDIGGMAGDAAFGAAGGKIGASLVGGAGKLAKGLTGDALTLAKKGVPLTVGQMAGGGLKRFEDSLTSVPVVGDAIRNAQRRGLEGVNRAAYDDTLAHIGEKLPADINIGRDAYNYTKQTLSDAYDSVLGPLTVTKDAPWTSAVGAAKSAAAKLGDPAIKDNVNQIIKTEVLSRFDKAGQMAGEDMKAAQEALTGHINDLSKGTKWSRDAAGVLKDLKGQLEGLVARVDPDAGEQLAKVNKAYSFLKPLENAAAKPSSKDGIFTIPQLSMGAAAGKSKATLAAGKAPHQELADASRILPSSVPDSGSAGRVFTGAGLMGLFGGHLPVVGPAALPAAGLIGGTAALYTRSGQKLLTSMMASRSPAVRSLGEHIKLLAAPAGTAGAVGLTAARQ